MSDKIVCTQRRMQLLAARLHRRGLQRADRLRAAAPHCHASSRAPCVPRINRRPCACHSTLLASSQSYVRDDVGWELVSCECPKAASPMRTRTAPTPCWALIHNFKPLHQCSV